MAALEPRRMFPCGSCDKVFGRAEHVRRHELIHRAAKAFICAVCAKKFTRRDALLRHESMHAAPPSLLQQGGRACVSCADAKVRCFGGIPCTRCWKKGIVCAGRSDGRMSDHTPATTGEVAESPQPISDLAGEVSNETVPVVTPEMFEPRAQGHLTAPNTNWLGLEQDVSNWNFGFSPVLLNGMAYGMPSPQYYDSSSMMATAMLNQPDIGTNSATMESWSNCVSSPHSSLGTDLTGAMSTAENPSPVGEYYVDGQSARLSRFKKRKISASPSGVQPILPSSHTFTFRRCEISSFTARSRMTVDMDTYQNICSMYCRLCLEPSAVWLPYEAVEFPSLALLQAYVGLYFEHFDQSLPVFHNSSHSRIARHGLLLLSMAAIGCHYDKTPQSHEFQVAMHEFVRRWDVANRELEWTVSPDPWADNAVQLLHILGMIYCGDERLQTRGLQESSRLQKIHASVQTMVFQPSYPPNTEDADAGWMQWLQDEERARLAHATWLLDAMLSYHFQRRPNLGLPECLARLPCPESLWDAETAEQWHAIPKTHDQSLTLSDALRGLHVEKAFPRDIGEFARVVVLHGLYQRQREIETYFVNPLSHWMPSASRQSASRTNLQAVPWLPSVPSFTLWQSSACDCLDVLHWQASATTCLASGLENSTVLQLHLARVVLLAPHQDIVAFARLLTNSSDRNTNKSSLAFHQQMVRKWATQHQYKARLSIIHAGVLFWHVRKFSIDTFYEAPAVALATLTLWAFGLFATVDRSNPATTDVAQQPTSEADEVDEREDKCEIVLLDRPTDDELVQRFIRSGQTMQAHLTGVGDLYAPSGPKNILVQGHKLLSTLQCWGVGSSWRRLLQALVNATPLATIDYSSTVNPDFPA